MSAWLTVIGVDAAGYLGPAARTFVDAAQWVFGSGRLLEAADISSEKRRPWQSPFSSNIQTILALRGSDIVVLATGDPMHYGVGATFAGRLEPDEMRVLPAPSAFSLAAARLGWPVREVVCASFHGRSVERLAALVQPGRRIIALTSNAAMLGAIAKLLVRQGYGGSRLTILENMGTPAERISSAIARDFSGDAYANLNTVAIACIADGTAILRSRAPGLPDAAFRHDGQLTKRECRAVTLSALAPRDGALLWDVGAGCGSVAIEWMRLADNAPAVAFERNGDRLAMIEENARVLGAPDLQIVAGDAAASMAGRPPPDAVFLGGSVSDDALFGAAWSHLKNGGCLVANAVTLEGEAALNRRFGALGGELVRIDVSVAEPVGAMTAMRPRRSVLQWRVVKEHADA